VLTRLDRSEHTVCQKHEQDSTGFGKETHTDCQKYEEECIDLHTQARRDKPSIPWLDRNKLSPHLLTKKDNLKCILNVSQIPASSGERLNLLPLAEKNR
jgi:hypothetical protein